METFASNALIRRWIAVLKAAGDTPFGYLLLETFFRTCWPVIVYA